MIAQSPTSDKRVVAAKNPDHSTPPYALDGSPAQGTPIEPQRSTYWL
jgi:hypothetical protein